MWLSQAYVECAPVKVKDAKAVQAILDRYDLTLGVAELEKQADGSFLLRLEGDVWPEALHRKADRQAIRKDVEAALSEHGEQRFGEFLGELARQLESPLTVRAVHGWDGLAPLDAREWHVRPGAAEVEVNGFRFPDRADEDQSWCDD